jgi:hypothetical protein
MLARWNQTATAAESDRDGAIMPELAWLAPGGERLMMRALQRPIAEGLKP